MWLSTQRKAQCDAIFTVLKQQHLYCGQRQECLVLALWEAGGGWGGWGVGSEAIKRCVYLN